MLRKSCVGSIALAAIAFVITASVGWADGVEGSLKDGPAPLPPEEYVWNGLYVGVGLGAGSFDHDVDVDASKTKTLKKRSKKCKHDDYYKDHVHDCDWSSIDPIYAPDPKVKSAHFSNDDWDVFGTVKLGYDRLIHNRFLIGAFVDFDFYNDADSSFSEPWIKHYGGHKKQIGSIDGGIDLDHVWSVGGRLGVLVTPRILLYGVGGYSEASLDGDVNVKFKHGPTLPLAAPDELQGYFLGGGGEIKLHKNVSLQFEYRWTDLDGDSASASASDYDTWIKHCKEFKLTKDYDARADFDGDIQSIRAVLVMKFGEHERPVEPLK